MKPVRIAQIGTKHDHAEFILDSILRQDCFEVVGIAAPDGETFNSKYDAIPHYTVDELLRLDGLEAVTIECAEDIATAEAQKFAERGIAVNLDKPGTDDAAAFRKLIETLKAGSVPFHTGYMYRYNPLISRAISMVKSGELGEIFSVEAQMSVLYDAAKRKWLGRYSGGMMYFLGCHLIDLVLQLMGEPEEILPLNRASRIDGVDALDDGFAVFRYPTGTAFIKTCTNEVNGFNRRQLVICGTKGTIEIKPLEIYFDRENIMTEAVISLKTDGNSTVKTEHIRTERFNRYDAMMNSFARQVRGETSPYSYDYELTLFNTIMKTIIANQRKYQ